MTVVDDLKAAREIVRTGWCSNGLMDDQGNLCVVGALNKVAGVSLSGPSLKGSRRVARRDAAYDALAVHLPEEFESLLDEYNDHPGTSHADVLNLFDKALSDLGGLG